MLLAKHFVGFLFRVAGVFLFYFEVVSCSPRALDVERDGAVFSGARLASTVSLEADHTVDFKLALVQLAESHGGFVGNYSASNPGAAAQVHPAVHRLSGVKLGVL